MTTKEREELKFYRGLTVSRHEDVTSIDGGKTATKLHELWEAEHRLRKALEGFRSAYSNNRKTSSLYDWNQRMKVADRIAETALNPAPPASDAGGEE